MIGLSECQAKGIKFGNGISGREQVRRNLHLNSLQFRIQSLTLVLPVQGASNPSLNFQEKSNIHKNIEKLPVLCLTTSAAICNRPDCVRNVIWEPPLLSNKIFFHCL